MSNNRMQSIDLLRGFIMMLMALDHASAMIGRVHFSEMWGVDFTTYPSLAWWFTRFVSHLCAPGFFFLMGMSIYLFAQKRLASSWKETDIRKYFFKRGGVILLLMFLLEFPAWGLGFAFSEVHNESTMPGAYTSGFLLPTTVLYGLGMCMILGSFLWKLRNWQLLLLSIGSFILSGWYISSANPMAAFHPLEHFLLVPGMSTGAMVIYPIIPWIGVSVFGIFWGQLLQKNPDTIYQLSFKTGIGFLLGFILLRFLGYANFQFTANDTWIHFFTLIKYPPSLTFILATIGLNLLLLTFFSKISDKNWLKPLKIFGQTAMFFYILHLYLYAVMSIAFPLGSGIYLMYALWAGGLVILYFVCHWFLVFKKQKPLDSWWRMI